MYIQYPTAHHEYNTKQTFEAYSDLSPTYEILEKDCRAHALNREDAMRRSKWRNQTWMIDDHDECEWVNVSSGTGSPGLSRTNSTEP